MMNKDLRRRVTALITALIMMTGLLAGCGREEESELITLRTMSVLGDDGIREVYTELLREYSTSWPGVYHVGTIADSDNAYKLDATFESTYTTSKYPHAVCYYTNTGIEKLSDQFVSVEEIRESYPDFASGVTDAAFDNVRAADGKVYCVPFGGNWTAVAVNTAMLNNYSLQPPETWQDLVVACRILSARGKTAIANPPDDSAALLELICFDTAGDSVMNAALSENALLVTEREREAWLGVFRKYEELCGINSFPPAVTTDEMLAALEQLAQVEAEKNAVTVSSGDVSGSDAPAVDVNVNEVKVNSVRTDAIELFNAGEAAMVIIDSDELDRITLEGFTLVAFPDCSQDGSRAVAGGYDTAWFITRRAFSDNSVRDAVVAFVDTMVGGKASDSFASLGYMPSVVSGGDVASGLYGVAASVDELMATKRTAANSTRFAALERIAAAISADIITPEQAVKLAADPSLSLTDVIEKPVNKPVPPQQTVPASPTDAVSASDAA